jgi:hypothetical protein
MILEYNTIHSEIQIKKYNTICLLYIKKNMLLNPQYCCQLIFSAWRISLSKFIAVQPALKNSGMRFLIANIQDESSTANFANPHLVSKRFPGVVYIEQ